MNKSLLVKVGPHPHSLWIEMVVSTVLSITTLKANWLTRPFISIYSSVFCFAPQRAILRLAYFMQSRKTMLKMVSGGDEVHNDWWNDPYAWMIVSTLMVPLRSAMCFFCLLRSNSQLATPWYSLDRTSQIQHN